MGEERPHHHPNEYCDRDAWPTARCRPSGASQQASGGRVPGGRTASARDLPGALSEAYHSGDSLHRNSSRRPPGQIGSGPHTRTVGRILGLVGRGPAGAAGLGRPPGASQRGWIVNSCERVVAQRTALPAKRAPDLACEITIAGGRRRHPRRRWRWPTLRAACAPRRPAPPARRRLRRPAMK